MLNARKILKSSDTFDTAQWFPTPWNVVLQQRCQRKFRKWNIVGKTSSGETFFSEDICVRIEPFLKPIWKIRYFRGVFASANFVAFIVIYTRKCMVFRNIVWLNVFSIGLSDAHDSNSSRYDKNNANFWLWKFLSHKYTLFKNTQNLNLHTGSFEKISN